MDENESSWVYVHECLSVQGVHIAYGYNVYVLHACKLPSHSIMTMTFLIRQLY